MNCRQFGLVAAGSAAAFVSLRFPALAQLTDKLAGDLKNGEFNWFPERQEGGPILIIVSLPEQKCYVYRNGVRIATSTCSTGKQGHRTPTGVFKILQKDKLHHSSTYNNAPMPNMNRLTWSGVALHAGDLPGYPASHGCVRLPLEFSEKIFGITEIGTPVIIANAATYPSVVAHPGMVLAKNKQKDFDAVAHIVKQKQTVNQQRNPSKPSNSAILISSTDHEIIIMDDGALVSK